MRYLPLLAVMVGCCGCGEYEKMMATGIAEQVYFARECQSYVSVFKTENERVVLFSDYEQPKDWGKLEIGESYAIEYEGTELISATPTDLERDFGVSGPAIQYDTQFAK